MSLNHYKLYLEQVFQFAETIVIKSEGSADSINKRLTRLYGDAAVSVDRRSWKYYLNLAGKYHHTDTKIFITSLDTLQQIEFNADNLLIHTATAKAYQYGTRYYRELVSQFPDYEQLILGVLYPVDIDKAIEAPDFSVIGYPAKYVEDNEESLIPNINKWLENYRTRWFNIQYTMSDTLYLTALLGIMYQQLIPLILTLRLRNCKTGEAHSFHIRQYLASHGMLDEYMDYLTKKQALFFYRNITYIERHAGKTETFDWLIDRVLTERDIPVFSISLAQDDSELLQTYRPKARFARTAINETGSADTSAAAFYSLSELLNREMQEAVGNQEYIAQNQDVIEEKIGRSKTNFLKTKVLESRMIDYSDAGLYSIQDAAISLWCSMSNSGRYSAVINFNDRVTNQNIPIDNHVAFLYFLYAYCKVYGIEIETVPEFILNRIAIDPVPSVEDLKKVVDKKYVSEEELHFLRSLHTPIVPVISTTAFSDLVKRTHVSYKAENMFAFMQNHLYKRALIKNASYRMYKMERVESFYIGKRFEDVFAEKGLPFTGFNQSEWADIYKELYEQATGIEINLTDAKAEMQASMVKLFKKLSSYSIQFLAEINKSTIRSINWSSLRMGDISKFGRDLRHVKLPIQKMLSVNSTSHDYRYIELKNLLQKFYIHTTRHIGFLDFTTKLWKSKPRIRKLFNFADLRFDLSKHQTCVLAMPEGLNEFKAYYDLPPEEKRKVRDVYTHYVTDEDFVPKVDIDSMEHVPKLLRTEYFYPPVDQIRGFNHYYIPNSFEFRVDRDYTELDAFDSNFGELISGRAFKPFVGFLRNNVGFKLSPGPSESILKAFLYTGGIRYNPGFGYSPDASLDVDIGTMNLVIEQQDIQSFTPTYDKQTLLFFHNTSYTGINLGSYGYTRINGEVETMPLIMDTRILDDEVLNAGSMVLDFKYNPYPINVIAFNPTFSTTILNPMAIEVGKFDLGNFYFSTGSMHLHFSFQYGKMDLGTMQYQATTTQLGATNILLDSRTLDNIFFAAGSFQLGIYKYERDTQNLDKYKWTLHDVDALIDYVDLNTEMEDFDFAGNLAEETDFDLVDFTPTELGTATYDSTNKQIIFS